MSHANNATLAMDEIVNEHYDAVFRYARSLVFTVADAEDLVQTTFLKLQRNLDRIRDGKRVRGWLINTNRRQFIDGYRHRKKFPKVSVDALEVQPAAQSRHPWEKLDAVEVLNGLHQLPVKYRDPLTLFYLQHQSYKEIAATLDIPIGTVMSRIRRGKDQLKAWMVAKSAQPAELQKP